jgi:hypothetical protein
VKLEGERGFGLGETYAFENPDDVVGVDSLIVHITWWLAI